MILYHLEALKKNIRKLCLIIGVLSGLYAMGAASQEAEDGYAAFEESLERTLDKAGWKRREAKSVIELHGPSLYVDQSNPAFFRRELHRMAGLASKRQALAFVARHPETLGFFKSDDDPDALARSINGIASHPVGQARIANLMRGFNHPRDMDRLEAAMVSYPDLFRAYLADPHLITVSRIVTDGSTGSARDAYMDWVADRLSLVTGEEKDDLVAVLQMHGPYLRMRASTDSSFALSLDQRWNLLQNAYKSGGLAFGDVFAHPAVFDVAGMGRASELFALRNLTPVDMAYLFFGTQGFGYSLLATRAASADGAMKRAQDIAGSGAAARPLSSERREALEELLATGDSSIVAAVSWFRDEPAFYQFAAMSLDHDDRQCVVRYALSEAQQLNHAGALEDINIEVARKALRDMVDDGFDAVRYRCHDQSTWMEWLPGYSFVIIYDKWSNNVDISTGDLAMAGIDLVDLLLTAGSGSAAAGKIGTTTIKELGEGAAVWALRSPSVFARRHLATQGMRNALRIARRGPGKNASADMTGILMAHAGDAGNASASMKAVTQGGGYLSITDEGWFALLPDAGTIGVFSQGYARVTIENIAGSQLIQIREVRDTIEQAARLWRYGGAPPALPEESRTAE